MNTSSLYNRIKFAVGGPILDSVNPLLPGRPHDRATAALADLRGGDVLELCAGSGYWCRTFGRAKSDVRVQGVDLSAESVRYGKRKLRTEDLPNVSLRTGDISELAYPDHSFDAVVAIFGLHEVDDDVRRAGVREAARLLRPGGRFVVVDVDRPRSALAIALDGYMSVMEPGDARNVFGSGLVDLLTTEGFDIVQHEPAGPLGFVQTVIGRVS